MIKTEVMDGESDKKMIVNAIYQGKISLNDPYVASDLEDPIHKIGRWFDKYHSYFAEYPSRTSRPTGLSYVEMSFISNGMIR